MNDYEIKTAHYRFTCPLTGKIIRIGDLYIERDGIAMSIEAGLPTRKLKPINLK